jgi:hypothetical protein
MFAGQRRSAVRARADDDRCSITLQLAVWRRLHLGRPRPLPPSVVSRRVKGEQPTIDLMIGYRKGNSSPILKTFLSRIDGLIGRTPHSGAK